MTYWPVVALVVVVGLGLAWWTSGRGKNVPGRTHDAQRGVSDDQARAHRHHRHHRPNQNQFGGGGTPQM